MSRFVLRNLRVLTTIVVLAVWAGRLATSGLLWADADLGRLPPSPPSHAVPTAGHLLDQHGCWRDQAPADMRGRLPGHVVVTTRSGRLVYGGERLVGQALDQEFGHRRTGLRIWGFCR